MTARYTPDPIAIELIRNALDGLSDEIAITIMRTARSELAKELLDFSTGILNTRGELIGSGLGRPGHLGMIDVVMRATMNRYPLEKMQPGDIFICNDPYEGGTHLPDIYVVKPAFHNGTPVGFAATTIHHTDVGGRVAGGNASDSTEIFQEGLRLPPLKFYSAGEPSETIYRIFEKNVRVPDQVIADLNSQVSSCAMGERGILKLIEEYGPENYQILTDALLDYTEQITRADIRKMPDGRYEFVDWIDGDGFGSGPIRLQLALIIEGDTITGDWTGTSPQVKGSINAVLGHTYMFMAQCLRCAFPSDPPVNAGFFRPIKIIAAPGSFVNAQIPAAVAARGLSSMRMEEVVWGAMAKMLPDKVFACSVGLDSGFTFAGYYPNRKPFVHMEFLHVSWGGRPNKDGIDALTRPGMTYSNSPVELIEAEQPLMIDEYSIVPNSGGPGKYRGGQAICRSYRLVGADESLLQLRTDRQRFLPYGLAGGKPGTPSRNILNPGTQNIIVPPKGRITLKKGDLFYHVTAGSGGWGDPLERDPQRVLEDLRNDKLTLAYVEREYGVVIDPETKELDLKATEQLRHALREARARKI